MPKISHDGAISAYANSWCTRGWCVHDPLSRGINLYDKGAHADAIRHFEEVRKNPPRRDDLKALYLEFKPREGLLRTEAKAQEERGDYQGALATLSEALTFADNIDRKTLRGEMLKLVRRMPPMFAQPEMRSISGNIW